MRTLHSLPPLWRRRNKPTTGAPRRTLAVVAMVVAMLTATAGLAEAATPALAAPTQTTTSDHTDRLAQSQGDQTLYKTVRTTVTVSHSPVTKQAATAVKPGVAPPPVYCDTYWVTYNNDNVFGNVLEWYKLTTYFCWNGDIVTTHSTTYAVGVTTLGTIGHYSWTGQVSSSWYCYYWNSFSCSGNTETSEGQFGGPLGAWYPQIQEWEVADGGTAYAVS